MQPQIWAQVTFSSLEDSVDAQSPVRFNDAFVEHLDLAQLRFKVPELKNEGRPAYVSEVLLKNIFIATSMASAPAGD